MFIVIIFQVYCSQAQSFQSVAKIEQLQVADIKPSKEGGEINTTIESGFLFQYHDPKTVDMRVKVSEKEIMLISEYPKHTEITYKVIKANLPVDAKFNYENPAKFECVAESGENCTIKYFLLNDMSREENRELENGDKVVMLVIQFPTNRYDYVGYLE